MCGRSCLSLNREQVRCACSYKPKNANNFVKPEWVHEHNNGKEFTPSHNIAPTDVTPVIVSASKFQNSSSPSRILKPMMWGIIPPWHKGDYRSHNLSTNNCRLENIQSSKLYNPVLKNGGRCVIIAEGFYEWQTTKGSGAKQPYFVYATQENNLKIDEPDTWNNNFSEENGWKGIKLLYMAGLFDVWKNNDIIIYSYSVITMESNSTLDWLHHRMPAILDNEHQVEAWLDIDNVSAEMAIGYLKPVKILAWHEVSSQVNNSRNKSKDCNKKILLQKNKSTQKTLVSWFTKTEKRKLNDENNPEPKKQKNDK